MFTPEWFAPSSVTKTRTVTVGDMLSGYSVKDEGPGINGGRIEIAWIDEHGRANATFFHAAGAAKVRDDLLTTSDRDAYITGLIRGRRCG